MAGVLEEGWIRAGGRLKKGWRRIIGGLEESLRMVGGGFEEGWGRVGIRQFRPTNCTICDITRLGTECHLSQVTFGSQPGMAHMVPAIVVPRDRMPKWCN